MTRHLFPRLLPAVATAALVAVLPARAEEYTAWTITGWTDRPEARYQPGEPMKFYFRILNANQPVPGKVRITLAADDGRRTETVHEVSAGKPLEITASLSRPGFVMARATLLTPQGNAARRPWRNQQLRDIQYGMGGCVEPEQLRPALPEPRDFDDFWTKARDRKSVV